jgi:thiamine transporter ThiT
MTTGSGHPVSTARILLGINAVASGAAAVVLTFAPALIPTLVGIRLDPSQFFLAYLLAASELALAGLCVSALRAGSINAVAQALMVLIVFHAASGLGGILAVVEGASVAILWNVLLRGIMMGALLYSVAQLKRE